MTPAARQPAFSCLVMSFSGYPPALRLAEPRCSPPGLVETSGLQVLQASESLSEKSFFARLEQCLGRGYLATCGKMRPSAMLRTGLACESCVVNAPQCRLAASKSFGSELAACRCALIGVLAEIQQRKATSSKDACRMPQAVLRASLSLEVLGERQEQCRDPERSATLAAPRAANQSSGLGQTPSML